ncbi:MAG: polysaccharide biosynthesis protein [Clostridia bacterium]|nr:polysaccharide biosynthesis protein [Clostridia bacterium]
MNNTVNTQKRSSKNLFFSGVLILTIANILVKSVGLISKIALNRVVGSIGAGYYSSAYEIYAFLYVISTAGLPVAISIMVSKARARGSLEEVNKIFNISFKVFSTVGLALTGLMVIFSDAIAQLMGAPETSVCIRTIAPTLLFICISSCIRGYFQGYQLMGPTAVSQLIEAVCKVAIGISLAFFAKSRGYSDHIVASYTVFGVTVGVFLGMVYLYVKKHRFKEHEYFDTVDDTSNSSSRFLIRNLMRIAIPITISSSVLSLTTILDTFMIQNRLLDFGMDITTIRVYYGDYTSLVISMFNLPTILIYPIANALVPMISASTESGDSTGAERMRELGIRLVSIISIPCAMGMSVFSFPILRLLMFKQDSVYRASPWLSISAISVFFLGIIAITNAYLNSEGKQGLPIISMLCGSSVKLLVSYFLIGKIGIIGAPIGTLLCYATASFINLYFVLRHIGKLPSPMDALVMPFSCAAICIGAAVAVYTVTENYLPSSLVTLIAILVASLVYFITVIKSGTVAREEIHFLPSGKKIIRLLEKFYILRKK